MLPADCAATRGRGDRSAATDALDHGPCPLVAPIPLLAAAAAAVLWAGLSALAGATKPGSSGRIYTVAAVRAYLAHDATGWLGRTLLVRGGLVPCMVISSAGDVPCAVMAPGAWSLNVVDLDAPTGVELLPIRRGDPDPALAYFRRMPLLGALLPPPQVLHWGVVATYRIRLQAVTNSLCGIAACYEALLLDAAP